MTVKITEISTSKEFSKETGRLERTRNFVVEGLRDSGEAAEAVDTETGLAIPDLREGYPQGPTNLRVSRVFASRYGVDSCEVEVNYTTRPYGDESDRAKLASVGGGEIGEVVVSYSLMGTVEDMDSDLDGGPVGMPDDPAARVISPTCEAVFTTWLRSFTVSDWWDKIGRVNSDTWRGAPPQTLLLYGVQSRQIDRSKFEASFTIHYNPRNWQWKWKLHKNIVVPYNTVFQGVPETLYYTMRFSDSIIRTARIYETTPFGAFPL